MKIFKFYLEYIEDHETSNSHSYYNFIVKNMPKKIIGKKDFFIVDDCYFRSDCTIDFMNGGRYFYFPGKNTNIRSETDYVDGTFRVLASKVDATKFNKVKQIFDRYTNLYLNSLQLELDFNDTIYNNIDYELVKSKTNKRNVFGLRLKIDRLDKIKAVDLINKNGFSLIVDERFNHNDNIIYITNGEYRIHFSNKESRDIYFNNLKDILEMYKTEIPSKKESDIYLDYIKRIYAK